MSAPTHLDQLDALDAAIARIDQEVDGNVEPFRVAIEMLATIPGVSNLSAEVIVSEIGIDMSRFRTEGHLISWAGLCSKNDESAGKRRSRRMKKGAPWLKTTLIQCAWAATRTKGTYLHAQYLRLRSRRGPKRAIGAVAASILTAAYHMLKNGTLYQDLGANHFDNRAKGKQVLRLLNRLRNLGFAVQITPVAV
jgi:transposase